MENFLTQIISSYLSKTNRYLYGIGKLLNSYISPCLAKKFGCTECVNSKDHNKQVQVPAEMTNPSCNIECTGNIDVMISAFECVHDGYGVAVLHKYVAVKTHPMNFLNERTLKGTFFGN